MGIPIPVIAKPNAIQKNTVAYCICFLESDSDMLHQAFQKEVSTRYFEAFSLDQFSSGRKSENSR